MNRFVFWSALFSIIASFAGIVCVVFFLHNDINYGFVNTEKLLNSFVESQKALDEIRDEEEKWMKEKRIIEDSLYAFEARMKKTYKNLSIDEKKKMKKEQTARIEELARFNSARAQSIQNLRTEKLQGIYNKINAAMLDFATERGLDVVFASSNGSIVYGEGSDADLTDAFLCFLNARFK